MAGSGGSRGVRVGGVEGVCQICRCLEGKEVPVVILGSSGRERVLPMVEHMARVVGSEGAGLCPEV